MGSNCGAGHCRYLRMWPVASVTVVALAASTFESGHGVIRITAVLIIQ